MRISHSLLSVLLLPFAAAVFVDEAYKIDFHYPLLGIPEEHTTFFHQPRSTSRASLLYTLSEKHVLGAVNPKDGTLVWRQQLGLTTNSSTGFLRAGEDEDILVSAVDGEVKAWDASNGRAVWTNEFEYSRVKDLEVLALADGSGTKGAKDPVVLFEDGGHTSVRRLDGRSGNVVWEHKDDSGDIPFQLSTSAEYVYVITLHAAGKTGFRIKVTTLDQLTGKPQGRYVLSSEHDILVPEDIAFVGANVASPIIAWMDKAKQALKINIIGSSQVRSLKIHTEPKEEVSRISVHSPHLVKSLPHFLVHYETASSHWAEVYHIDLTTSSLAKAYDLPVIAGKGVFSTSTQDANVYFTRQTATDIVLVSSASHGVLARWPVSLPRVDTANGQALQVIPLHAASEVVSKTGNSFAIRCALTLETGDWLMVRNGERDWVRAEALSGAVAAVWADSSQAEALAAELKVEGHQTVLAAYSHRVKRHLRDLRALPAWISKMRKRLTGSIAGRGSDQSHGHELQEDSFGFHKLVIVATENGRLYALDVGDQGRVVWNVEAIHLGPREKWDVKSMLVDSVKGELTVRGSTGDVAIVDTRKGTLLFSSPPGSSRRIESVAIVETESGRSVINIYNGGEPGDIPIDQAPLNQQTIVVRGKAGSVKGLNFIPEGSVARPVTTWQFVPTPDERIATVLSRPAHDPVASIGRVLGNRSVMYKYLNPNLLLIAVLNDAAATATLHILDSVSGRILHSVVHTGVDTSRPLVAAMSENWIVYSFWGEPASAADRSSSAKGYQLAILELYESSLANDRGDHGNAANFSALDPFSASSTAPHVLSQSFVVPEQITHLAITQTKQGITTRAILATLPFSNALISIPRALLDPRRPVGRDPTPAEQEEGLVRYSPVIGFDPKWLVSHRRELMGLGHGRDRGVITSPTLLESTSLVFAYGLDLFGTRVAPSLAFDVLDRGFARGQLLLTVLALGAGVWVMVPLVQKKQINAQWQVPA